MDLIAHTHTKSALENFLKKPTHGLILLGSEGSGKLHIAKWLAKKLNFNEYIVCPLEDKNTISIDQVRDLYGLTKTGSKLVIIIKDAQTMGHEAQNAFLKLLEEPPKNTYFVLTTNNSSALLTTIKSRAQTIEVLPPKITDILDHAKKISLLSDDELKSLLLTTKGRIGQIINLLTNEAELEAHRTLVAEVKHFYAASSYEKHIMCTEKKFEKQWISGLLEVLSIIVHTLMKQQSGNVKKLHKLASQAESIEETSRNILKIPGNPKIHISKLIAEL